MAIIELHIKVTPQLLIIEDEQKQKTVVELLHDACDLTKGEIKQAIDKGALWLSREKRTKRLRRLKTSLKDNDEIHFYYNDEVLRQAVPQAHLIADYNDYSVWYKPFGMLSQGSKWSDHCTITRFSERYFNNNRASFIVHRLDKAATGLIIVAHTKKAAKALSGMFEAHNFDKYYQIIVSGDFSQVDYPRTVKSPIDDKESCTIFDFKAFDKALSVSLLNVKIETGRKHQIRKHAASINFPVIGDRLHGDQVINQQKFPAVDLQLCAVKLEFNCPLTETPRKVELPDNLKPKLSNLS